MCRKTKALLGPSWRADSYDAQWQTLIFIDAPGGTGKTFLLKTVLAKVRSTGGRTAHSRFKILLTVKDNHFCNFDKNSNTAGLFRHTRIIVWDECSMMRRESLEAVNRTLQDVCNSDKPFGGILTICCGDVRHLLPVIKRGSEADVENACIKNSYLWPRFRKFQLTQNMRLDEDSQNYATHFPIEFLDSIELSRLPPHKLQLLAW